MTDTYLKALLSIIAPLTRSDDSERGDVPGWVMITMMSAILVAAILVVAQDALVNMFNNAMAMINR
ncbi:MAG: hypothetical protein Q4A03_00665 [Rothia sp. (in: high G+C Gram-positive bacteria)]|uniref:hypothetical protein n=1 Tax=Rothia sp. (in: high G+C Gram-positive bacteria) TaxID=1885016 RepID=UPI0026FF8267|nr:hypothetical protein [Rothia sp. (in: high G+C Gram-positive bacteria)]